MGDHGGCRNFCQVFWDGYPCSQGFMVVIKPIDPGFHGMGVPFISIKHVPYHRMIPLIPSPWRKVAFTPNHGAFLGPIGHQIWPGMDHGTVARIWLSPGKIAILLAFNRGFSDHLCLNQLLCSRQTNLFEAQGFLHCVFFVFWRRCVPFFVNFGCHVVG